MSGRGRRGSFYKDSLRPSLLTRRGTEREARREESREQIGRPICQAWEPKSIRPIILHETPAKRLNDAAKLARAIGGKIKLIINRGSTVEFRRPVFTPAACPVCYRDGFWDAEVWLTTPETGFRISAKYRTRAGSV